MKHNFAFALLLIIVLVGPERNIRAQTGTVTFTEPPSSQAYTMITQDQQNDGVFELQAQATPTGTISGQCLTFDWQDQYGADWGPGEVSPDGLTSTLEYTIPGFAYDGAPIKMTVKVTEGDPNPSSSTTYSGSTNLVLPILNSRGNNPFRNDLSYYGGTLFLGPGNLAGTVSWPTGGGETALQVKVQPAGNPLGLTYQWDTAGGSIGVIPDTPPDDATVTSSQMSAFPADQELDLEDSSGDVCASLMLTVHYPTSLTTGNETYIGQAETVAGVIVFKGWSDNFQLQVQDQLGGVMPDNTPVAESFDAPSGVGDYINTWWPFQATASWATWYTNGGQGWLFGAPPGGGQGDTYEVSPVARIPVTVWRGDEYDSEYVLSATQYYTAGVVSTALGGGVQINSHTLTFYRGYATR